MSENYTKGSIPEYKINIDNVIYQKIMHWINKATGEVSGLGKLTIDKDTGLIEIKSAVLLKQENTSASTDLDGAAIAKAMFETRNDEGYLNWWWHSHVNMDVFWSGTDMDTIRDIGKHGFVVATVFNKKNEMLSSIYRKGDDFFPETFIDGISTEIMEYIDQDKIIEWDKEFEDKCKNIKYPSYKGSKWDSETQSWNEGDYEMGVGSGYWYGKEEETLDRLSEAHEEAKIFDVLPELEFFGTELKNENKEKLARSILHKICSKIDKLNISNAVRSYELKKPYILTFNKKFPTTL